MSKSSMRGGSWKQFLADQDNVTFSQASPVQNTWYTVFEKNNCAIRASEFAVADTGEDIEVKMTIDGTARTGSATFGAAAIYNLVPQEGGNPKLDNAPYPDYRGGFQWQGRSIKIEMRKTSAAGTGTFSATVKWGK